MNKKPIFESFRNAFAGIRAAYKSERNLKIHFFILFLVIASGFIFRISLNQWLVIILIVTLVLSTEMMNTALEKMVDFISPDDDPQAKIIKDISAGGVLICAIAAVIIGLMIFLPKIPPVF